jgi:hypothetical protein
MKAVSEICDSHGCKNKDDFWDDVSCNMLDFTDVSEVFATSIIRPMILSILSILLPLSLVMVSYHYFLSDVKHRLS